MVSYVWINLRCFWIEACTTFQYTRLQAFKELQVTFVCVQVEAVLRGLRYMNREGHVKLHPHTAQLLACRDDITQTHLSLSHMESCYNQVHSHKHSL